ncbi:hypothetical protein ACH5RR_001164 [Cinchona calisaya]|uniref:GTD-binding domain-containing protein n=1 Tax=Cinchona calisaya TaxID=153742 RepID=A0ABD3B3E9_9GENT
MDGRGIISFKEQQRVVPPTITKALASAVLEWFLIFLLFIDACFSYLVTKFACYNELQIPCLLCSRLDHVLGREKAGFYWDLICNKHKLKISSLVLCELHNNLVDVHGICENCLFSFATVNKSNAETYRLLVGKLGDEPHIGYDHDPLLADHSVSALDGKKCSCCNEQCISRGQTHMLFQTNLIGYEAGDLDGPLLATNGHDQHVGEIRDVSSQKTRTCNTGKKSVDPLLHVEYEKVKMTSDTESEAPTSDDDSATNLFCVSEQGKNDLVAVHMEKDLPVDVLALEKLIDPDAASEPALLESELQVEASDSYSTASAAPVGNGLEELSWQHVKHKTCVCPSSELISSNEVIPSSVDESRDNLDAIGVTESKKAVTNSSEMAQLPSNSISINEKQPGLKSGTCETGFQMPSSLELGDAYKLAIGSRGRQLSGKFLEQKSLMESVRMSEDLKLLLSQLSAARGIDVPLYDIGPRLSGSIDEFRTSDTSTSVGIQILQRRISLERNESGISLDGSIVSEIEGESAVDRLKRQVEHDRKLLGALYKELEEERSASAVAANQAMAMITRLQEEKAAFHMEALQCVRMMEEQAEYDGEALQKANHLLAEREREIQDLESELEAPNNETDEKINFTRFEDIYMKDSQLVEFKDETFFILQCLRKLEKKLQLFLSSEALLDVANGDDLSLEEKISECGHSNGCNASPKNYETEVDGSPERALWREGSISAREISAGQYEDSQQLRKQSGELKHGKHICENAELEALRNEFLVLSGRLHALEAEHSFLEHSINSLSRGDEGIKLIQEVACQVRELHSIGIKRRN